MSINRILLNRLAVRESATCIKLLRRRLINPLGSFLALVGLLFSGETLALINSYSNVVTSYSDCAYRFTGFEYVFGVTLNFNPATRDRIAYQTFQSRGFSLYAYDKNGAPYYKESVVTMLTLDGVTTNNALGEIGFVSYYSHLFAGLPVNNVWGNANAFSGRLEFTIPKDKISTWPAVGIRAVNALVPPFGQGVLVADESGIVYIGPSTKGGICTLYNNPLVPPPAVAPKVTMTAPDWDLGELPAGEETVLTLPATKDQLCFSYEGSTAITNQKYLINATNSNGFSPTGGYLLKSLEDSSQTVPYTLTLDNSTDSVSLPNAQSRLFSLAAGGRTCFTPTFKAQPDKTVKTGAYSDILTFTVVAKP